MSSSSLLSPPPSPHSAPLPLPLSSSSPPSSSLTRCPELDLSVTLGSAHKTSCIHVKPRPLKTSQQSDQSQLRPGPQGQMGRKGNIQVCFEEPVVVTVTADQSRDAPPQQLIRGPRRSSGCRHVHLSQWTLINTMINKSVFSSSPLLGGAPKQWVEPPAAVSNQDPRHLEKAGLNTTLALKAELQSLQGAEFNSQNAIQEMLRRSERTKNLISTRATEEVNVCRSQHLFSSLVCVDVPEDQLTSQVLQQAGACRGPLLPPCHGNKAADGPSLRLFMTSDHLRQKPLPPEEEPVNYKSCSSPCPAYSTFDLYKRGRC